MAYTSPSVANKGNWIHISTGFPALIVLQENLTFNLLQRVMLSLPVYSPQSMTNKTGANLNSVAAQEQDLKKISCYQDIINVDRVVDNYNKLSNNLLSISLPANFAKYVSCNINNIKIIDRLIPNPSYSQALAVAIYSYEINVRYLDFSNHTNNLTFQSGPRHQQVFLKYYENSSLKVELFVNCLKIIDNKLTTS